MVDTHSARVLLLIDTFSSAPDGALDGLTKLAKLDFLLRYPSFLDVLNRRLGIQDLFWTPPSPEEQLAIESPMIRYKYGPWDNRYYSMIGGLVGRGLVEYVPGPAHLSVRPTSEGRRVAAEVRQLPVWHHITGRLDFLRHHYDFSGSRLKQLIYDSFPDLVSQPLGSPIGASPQWSPQ